MSLCANIQYLNPQNGSFYHKNDINVYMLKNWRNSSPSPLPTYG